MGLLRSLLGSKNAGMMACFDIAKPLTMEAVICSGMLAQYKEYIPEDDRGRIAIYIAMMYSYYFMHYFNRQYFRFYGSQELSTAQRMLFPTIAFEFNKQFGGNVVSDEAFFETYNNIEQKLEGCDQILSSDGSFNSSDQDSALSVFVNILCKAIFGDQADNPMIISTVAKVANDGVAHINFQPKLIELNRWCCPKKERIDMTRKVRIGLVISVVWFILVLGISVGESDAVQVIILSGVLPLVVGWGIYWIRREKN